MSLSSIDLSNFINEKFSVKVIKNHILQAGHEINYKKYLVNSLIQENRKTQLNFLQRKISNKILRKFSVSICLN